MGGFVQGPIVRFQADVGDLQAQIVRAVASANAQLAQQNQQFSRALTGGEDPNVAGRKLAASISPAAEAALRFRTAMVQSGGAMQGIQQEQRRIVGLLDREIAQLIQKQSLTKAEATELRRLTLERERQSDALAAGTPVGLTLGTQQALQRATVSAQVFARLTGLQIPRSLERIIAQSPAVESALTGAFKAGVIVFLAEQLVRAIDRLIGFTEQLNKVRQAFDEMNAAAGEANKTLLGPQTLAQVNTRIVSVTAGIEDLNRQLGLTGDVFADSLRRGLAQYSGSETILLDQLDRQKKLLNDLYAEQARLNEIQRRTEPIEILKLQNQVRQAGLVGILRVRQEEVGALRVVALELQNNVITERAAAAQRLAIASQSNAAIFAMLLENLRTVEALQARVNLIGVGAVMQIRLRAQQEIAAIEANIRRLGPLMGPEDISKSRAEQALIRQGAAREEAELFRRLQAEGAQSILQAQASVATGLARIEAERAAALGRIQQQEDELARGIIADQGKITQETIRLSQERTAVQIEFDNRVAEARQRITEDTLRIQEEAALASVPPWQRAQAAILLSEQQRLRQLDLELARSEITWEDFNKRREAIWQETNARLTQELAGELEGFFGDLISGNIGRRIQQNIQRFLFQTLAQQLVRSGALGSLGGILPAILGLPSLGTGGNVPGMGPGGTPVFNPRAGGVPGVGIAAPTASVRAGSVAVQTPSTAIQTPSTALAASLVTAQTPLMNVTAAIVNVQGLSSGPAKSFLDDFGSFFRPPGGGGGGFFSRLGPFVPSAMLLGQGIASRNLGSIIGGGGALAGTVLARMGHGALGPAVAGASLLAGGIIGGNIGLGAAGGAILGFQLGGPIGAGIGLVAGALLSLFRRKKKRRDPVAEFNRMVEAALKSQTEAAKAFISPEQESFFANTQDFSRLAGTTFGQQAGGQFFESPLNPPMSVNIVNNISAVDARGLDSVLTRHGPVLAGQIRRLLAQPGTGSAVLDVTALP